jgi:hypothetical protein
MGNDNTDFDYCQGNSTIILSFERETGKWIGWKGLAGICEFGETGCVSSLAGFRLRGFRPLRSSATPAQMRNQLIKLFRQLRECVSLTLRDGFGR